MTSLLLARAWQLLREAVGPLPATREPMAIFYRWLLRVALLMTFQWCLTRAFSFSGPNIDRTPPGIDAISTIVPLDWWIAGWFISAGLALIAIVPCRPGGSLGLIIMSTIWAIGYTYSWLSTFALRTFHLGLANWTITVPRPPSALISGATDYRFASTYWFAALFALLGYFFVRGAFMSVGHGGRDAT